MSLEEFVISPDRNKIVPPAIGDRVQLRLHDGFKYLVLLA